MKFKNQKLILLTFCLVFIISIFSFMTFADNATVDFTGLVFQKSASGCEQFRTSATVSTTIYDLNTSALNDNCKASWNGIDYYLGYNTIDNTPTGTPIFNFSSDGSGYIQFNKTQGADGSKYIQPYLIIDLNSEYVFDSNTNLEFNGNFHEPLGVNETINYVSFLDSDGVGLFTSYRTKGNVNDSLMWSGYSNVVKYIGDVTLFSNTTYTATTNTSKAIFRLNKSVTARYLVVAFRSLQDNQPSGTAQYTLYNYVLENYQPDPCSNFSSYSNNSIITSVFQEYFNYNQQIQCNGWIGTGKYTIPTNNKLQIGGSDLLYTMHTFLPSESVTLEYDINYTADGSAVSLIDQTTSKLLSNTIMTGNKIYFNNNEIGKTTTAGKVYHFKIFYTTFEKRIYVNITENGVSYYYNVFNTISDLKPAGIDIYKYGLSTNFNIDNILIYQGGDKFINQNTILLQSNTTIINDVTTSDLSKDFNNYLENNGFMSSTSKLVFWLILMLIVMFFMIYLLRNHIHHSVALVGIIGIVEIIMFILGYTFGFIPFWILFLVVVTCIVIIVAYIAQKVSPPSG